LRLDLLRSRRLKLRSRRLHLIGARLLGLRLLELRRPGRRKLLGPWLLGAGWDREQRRSQDEGGAADQTGRHGMNLRTIPEGAAKTRSD
jgi:hypothetical protein